MGDSEDETGYPKKFYPLNRQTHPMYTRPIPKRHAYYHEEEDEEEDQEDDVGVGGVGGGGGYSHRERFQKRLKPTKPVPGYDFGSGPSETKAEQEAFVVLEVWGDRFLQLGRRSLRNEDWNEVAEKVSEELRSERSETQCRRMVDNLKRKYKKERVKVDKLGLGSSKWSFFNKMDMLLGGGGSSAKPEFGLACGVDSGEFVFMNTKVYLEKSNGFDEMMDSPGDSEEDDDEEEEVEYERRRKKGDDAASYKLLAESVERFGKVYEKMERSKKEQMKELEKMRGEFQRDLELQKKQIVERAQSEIARLREEEEENETHHDDDGGESEDEGMENDSDVNLSD
ncbi:trihelix transcription factor ASIL2 [Brassica rapa]|uniref:Myb/SANT-like DNA-binding domain-containing protein n=1 Tax=Brassica campestris TaxID=3711 RepID=M4CCM1_BRACM|nr:trihelix transcription factor ASIL2 [Brassica rapa]